MTTKTTTAHELSELVACTLNDTDLSRSATAGLTSASTSESHAQTEDGLRITFK